MKYPIYVSKQCCEKIWTGDEGKKHYVPIKDFSTFMYDRA